MCLLKKIFFLCVISLGNLTSPSQGAPEGSPVEFIEGLIKQGMEVAQEKNAPEEKFGEVLKDHFALEGTAKYIMGKNWNRMNASQREKFIELLTKRLVRTYSTEEKKRIFRNSELTIQGPAVSQPDQKFLVKSTFKNKEDNSSNEVIWIVKQEGNKFLVLDIKIAGISQLITLRADYKSLFGREGTNDIDKSLQALENR